MPQPNDIASIRERLVEQSRVERTDGFGFPRDSFSDSGSDITALLQDYDDFDLSDLSQAELMQRMDTKYIIPIDRFPAVLSELRSHYSVLDIDGDRTFTYENTYFDTADLRFYHMHHNGARPRFKIRHRRYRETETAFLEAKIKTNKNVTYKERVRSADLGPDPGEIRRFARPRLPGNTNGISPSLRVDFQRITFAAETSGERLTLDVNVRFRAPGDRSGLHIGSVAIAEYKTLRDARPRYAFPRIMRRYRISPGPFSKYCVGTSLLYPTRTKANRFKPILLKLQQIHQGASPQP